MFDSEFVKWLVGMGVGGSIAALIFMFYRKDVKSYTDLWKEATTMILSALQESTRAHITNTASNGEMIGLLRALHRRLDVENAERREIHEANGGRR